MTPHGLLKRVTSCTALAALALAALLPAAMPSAYAQATYVTDVTIDAAVSGLRGTISGLPYGLPNEVPYVYRGDVITVTTKMTNRTETPSDSETLISNSSGAGPLISYEITGAGLWSSGINGIITVIYFTPGRASATITATYRVVSPSPSLRAVQGNVFNVHDITAQDNLAQVRFVVLAPPVNSPPSLSSPSITGTLPVPASGGPVDLTVQASDDKGVSSVTAEITKPGGSRQTVSLSRFAGTATNGFWRYLGYSVPANPTTAEQQYQVTFIAVDTDGATGTSSQTFSVAPAAITIVSAFMRSAEEVEILLDRQFGEAPASVAVELTVDGVPYPLRTPVQLPSSDGPEPFVFNLATSGQTAVPRFTRNSRLTIRASATLDDGEVLEDTHSMLVLLPVVLVPGLNNGSGGFTHLQGIRDAIQQQSQELLDTEQLLGEPYRTMEDATSYPTLFALEYATNTDSFAVGSQKLQSLVGFALSRTYAARVNLVGYSKGALVARQFVVSGDNARSVHQFIMCAAPNTGSVAAYFQDFFVGDPTNLYPTWPWLKQTPQSHNYRVTPNRELVDLNRVPLPTTAGVEYTLFYSDTGSVEHIPVIGWLNNGLSVINWGNFPFRPPVPLIDQRGPGDGIVPRFSALGYVRDLNDDRDPDGLFSGELIPAFRGVPILREPVPGFHAGYMNQPGMINRLPSKLLEDVVGP